MFVAPGVQTKFVPAEKTKLSVQTITEFGFDGALYAADQSSGLTSEINGRVSVTDCTKAADFGVWDELVGNYRLISFDGRNQDGRASRVAFDYSEKFRNPDTKEALRTLLLPLYSNPAENTMFQFGPMKGLGISRLNIQGTTKTLTYSHHGPVLMMLPSSSTPSLITLNLEVRAIKSESSLDLSYTIEIPGQVPLTTHQMVLMK